MGECRGERALARWVAFAVAAVLLVAGLVTSPPAVAAPAADLTAGAAAAGDAGLAAALKKYLATKQGRYSVTVTELDGAQRTLSLSGGRRVEPASTIKLFYAWAVLRAVDEGRLTLDSRLNSGLSVGRCLSLMIQVSDNACAIDLRTKIGSRKLNQLFASEGYADTYIVLDSKGRYVTKRTSTDDLARLLARLERGELLSEAMSHEFTSRLLAQIWRQRITSGVAAGTVVASKSGQLWVSSGMVEADTAIVYGPNSTYVLTAVGTNNASGLVIRGISSIVYRYLQGDHSSRATFPLSQYSTTARVKMRKSPSTGVIRYLPAGTTVQVLYSAGLWMRVKVAGKYGWVSFAGLALRKAYRWPAPADPGELSATGAPCTIVGTSGDDVLTGTSRADVICGLEGDDTIDAGGGADTVDGGAGDDLLLGGPGGDYLIGGTGADTASYAYITATDKPVVADLDGVRDDGVAGENDRIHADVENLIGSSGNDTLTGNAHDNTLSGGGGNDRVRGGDGADWIEGGPGADVVDGGTATDTCVFDAGDPAVDASTACEAAALRLESPLTDLAQQLRPFSDEDPARCLVDNCGVTDALYCFVNATSGLVDDCTTWDGWGDGWWEQQVTGAGPYIPESDWVILARTQLPPWATFVETTGSVLLAPQ